MQADKGRWTLFGLNLQPWVDYCRAGLRELFWGNSTDIRRRLETPVKLQGDSLSAPRYYAAEQPLPDTESLTRDNQRCFQACLFPSDHVLMKPLVLPESLEADLPATLAFEAQASSPFPADDTCYGWALTERREGKLHLQLAIVALSDVLEHLRREGYDPENREQLPEVWCFTANEVPVVLQGFGEARRRHAYRRRLAGLALGTATFLLLFIALLAVPGLVRQMQADNMEHHYELARDRAAQALQLRDQLNADNQRASVLQEWVNGYHDYHQVLDHLSHQTPDDIHLLQLEVNGDRLRLQGRGTNAAEYMQLLSNDDSYADVSATSAFRRDRTGLERFGLELQLASGETSR